LKNIKKNRFGRFQRYTDPLLVFCGMNFALPAGSKKNAYFLLPVRENRSGKPSFS